VLLENGSGYLSVVTGIWKARKFTIMLQNTVTVTRQTKLQLRVDLAGSIRTHLGPVSYTFGPTLGQ